MLSRLPLTVLLMNCEVMKCRNHSGNFSAGCPEDDGYAVCGGCVVGCIPNILHVLVAG